MEPETATQTEQMQQDRQTHKDTSTKTQDRSPWNILDNAPRNNCIRDAYIIEKRYNRTKKEHHQKKKATTTTTTTTYVREKRPEEPPHPVPQACVEVVEDDLRLVGRDVAVVEHLGARHDVRDLEKRCRPVRQYRHDQPGECKHDKQQSNMSTILGQQSTQKPTKEETKKGNNGWDAHRWKAATAEKLGKDAQEKWGEQRTHLWRCNTNKSRLGRHARQQ